MITATSIGPIVKPDLDVISWGPTPCLADVPRGLRLSNPGKIPAPFKVFLKSSRSKFRVDIREGVLAPSEVSTCPQPDGHGSYVMKNYRRFLLCITSSEALFASERKPR